MREQEELSAVPDRQTINPGELGGKPFDALHILLLRHGESLASQSLDRGGGITPNGQRQVEEATDFLYERILADVNADGSPITHRLHWKASPRERGLASGHVSRNRVMQRVAEEPNPNIIVGGINASNILQTAEPTRQLMRFFRVDADTAFDLWKNIPSILLDTIGVRSPNKVSQQILKRALKINDKVASARRAGRLTPNEKRWIISWGHKEGIYAVERDKPEIRNAAGLEFVFRGEPSRFTLSTIDIPGI